MEITPELYKDMTDRIMPKSKSYMNIPKAFLIGGAICLLGECLLNLYEYMGLEKEAAGSWTSITLVFLSALLTGLGWYERIAKHAGAGTLVPITGFANSVAASAIEFKKEGQVFGIGCKIFTIAGPVILYGLFSSWLLGLIYYIIRMWRIL